MRLSRKIACTVAAVLMTLCLAATAFAAPNSNTHTITIEGGNAGHTYQAYRVFEGEMSNGKLTAINWSNGVNGETLLAALKAADSTTYGACTTAADVAKVLERFANNSAQLDAFAQLAVANLGTAAGESTATASPYTISVTGDGYYLVIDKAGVASGQHDAYTKAILNVSGNVTINVKSSYPTLEKKIIEGSDAVDYNNAAIGDAVSYRITTSIPDMDGYSSYQYTIHDTLSAGLTFNTDSLAITIGEKTLVAGTDYTVAMSGTGITIDFIDFIDYKGQTGNVVTTYTATLNENAVVGSTGNPNEAYLVFSNNPNAEGEGSTDPDNPDEPGTPETPTTPSTGETPPDEVITYTTSITILKVDASSSTNNPLEGATFTITAEGATKPLMTVTSDENGIILFKGLEAGTYTIAETEAPAGYEKIEEPIVINVAWAAPTNGSELCTWNATIEPVHASITDGTLKIESGVISFTVENLLGSVLPSTGGMGALTFYLAGITLMLSTAMSLVVRRRMQNA